MRLWTVHPKYLDVKGLVAAWREALLAQKVLAGETRGYLRHSQLIRFQCQSDPGAAMSSFLAGLVEEARRRGYGFDESKIVPGRLTERMEETCGQLSYEWGWLRSKLRVRAPELWEASRGIEVPEAHPVFRIVPGAVNGWEKVVSF